MSIQNSFEKTKYILVSLILYTYVFGVLWFSLISLMFSNSSLDANWINKYIINGANLGELDYLEKNDIITIDLTTFFDQEDDLKQYFPLGYAGHYNKKGYKKISNILIDKIKEIE